MSATQPKRPPVDPLDFVEIDASLTEEERLIRDTMRNWVRDRVLPEIADWYDRGTPYPKELLRELGELGALGMSYEGYGMAGLGPVAYGLASQELEAGDSAIRSGVSVQGSLVMFPIWKFGSEEQKQEWLPRLARGEAIGCFGLTEPDSGSDPGSMRTRARRDGSDWVLDGTKAWISNGTAAHVAVVWAQTDDGIRGFVVPTDTPGFSAREIPRRLSLRASLVSELSLQGVRLPEDAVLPGVTGLRGALACLSEARYGIAWGAMGAARACYEIALDYARGREQFGRPIAGFQLTQRKLADMLVELTKGQLLALHLGRLKERGAIRPEHISLGKLNNVREALAIAREARSILGANGISLDYHVIRHATNLESVLTYEGTNEVHTLVLGQAITGLAAYS